VLIGSKDDAAIARAVTGLLRDIAYIDLCGRTALYELGAIFGQCAAAFGPDCGPMHIAAAVGCPIVSLWGSTAPERSAPWGFTEYSIRGDIPCHPCYLRSCPVGRECMRRIAPSEVATMVRRALARSGAESTVDEGRA
jgi:ADP-heptose:LPS heptosyltransferase